MNRNRETWNIGVGSDVRVNLINDEYLPITGVITALNECGLTIVAHDVEYFVPWSSVLMVRHPAPNEKATRQ